MKTIYLTIAACAFMLHNSSAQYCGSQRYDTEVFQTVQTTNDVVYGANIDISGTNQTLLMDIYQPAGDTISMRPMIVWVHGGSFVGGTKNDVDVVSLCQHFAKRGYVCASIEYRLGMSSFPPTATAAKSAVYRAVQDMKAAVRFFRQDAATSNTYKIDPSVIFGGGSSAGAFAALHLAYMDEPSELPVEIDTIALGGMEGNSGNPGYSSDIKAVINLCGALGDKTWIHAGDEPLVSMHGTADQTVPYATDTIIFLGLVPIMQVDGSYSISAYADSVGLTNEMYTFYGSDHVPYASNLNYMDTTVRFVSNFLYTQLGCTPTDPTPLANTFTTGIATTYKDNNISVYPNPSAGKINFSFQTEVDLFSVYDLSGRTIVQINNPASEITLYMPGIKAGIYFYNVRNNGKTLTGKFIINE